jgi:hypothetical protein
MHAWKYSLKEDFMAFCTKCGAPTEGAFCTKCGAKIESPGEAGAQTPQSEPAGTSGLPPQPTTATSSSDVPPAPPPSPTYSAPSPAAPPATRKFGPIFWILGGCLVLIIIGVILAVSTGLFIARKAGIDPELAEKDPALAAVKMMASLNPDIEVLSVDEDRGTIEMRDKETGKTVTMNLDDVKEGRITFKDDEDQEIAIQAQGEGDDAELEIQSSDGTILMGSSAAAQLPAWLPVYPSAQDSGTFGLSTRGGLAGTCAFKTDDSVEDVASFYENALARAGFEVHTSRTQLPQGSIIILTANEADSQRNAQVTTTDTDEGTAINLAFQDEE